MAITYQVETFVDIMDELPPLVKAHWEEVAEYQDKLEFDPNWEAYARLDELGLLSCTTVRDNDDLIGYMVFCLQPHMHCRKSLYAINDFLYLDPEYRGTSIATKMFIFAEECLRDSGVDVIHLSAKTKKPFDKLAEFLHYDTVEIGFSKYIGE